MKTSYLVTIFNPATKMNRVFVAHKYDLKIVGGVLTATDVYGEKITTDTDNLISISGLEGGFSMDLDD